MKLRTKIFLVFSILATIPLFILTSFAYERHAQVIDQRITDVSERLFDNVKTTANNTLDGIRQVTGAFQFYYNDGSTVVQNLKQFADPERKPSAYEFYTASQEFNRTCQSLLFSNPYIYGIYILTPSGYILNYTNGANGTMCEDPDLPKTNWYQETLRKDGELYVSLINQHEIFSGDKNSIFFAQSLKDVYSHQNLGILLIDCDPEMFDLSAANTMPDITLMILDNTERQDVLYTNYEEIGRVFSEKNRQMLRTDLNLSPLRLTLIIDYDTLYKEFNITGVLMLLVCGVCALGFIIFAYIMSRYMVHPVEHLSRKMASQKGHTLIQSTQYLNRKDEIGTLYNEYNAMVESLNASVKQDYHDKLVILDAQMKSLEAQINPHFLFNTLESINSMAELDDNEQIATMSMALGNMFRYTLKTQSELVTVEDELGHVNDYVSIQQLRFDSRFRLEVHASPEFRKLKVLKLILQPLVENALYHGLQYCTMGDFISIKGQTDERFIYIDVYDNGQGMDEVTLRTLQNSLNQEASFTELGHRNKQSIGLKNIHSRIELYYGRGYALFITSQPGEWSNIRIKLPILKQEETVSCELTLSSMMSP